MATTPIKFPALPTGLTLTCDVTHPSTLAVLETVTLTEASQVYSGNVTGAHSGQLLFVLKASGSIFGSRLRTIEDTTATFVILTELETYNSDGRGAYPVTITVDDGTDPVVGATVRITATGKLATQTTISGGIAKFALDNGSYVVTITASGYEPLVDALTVSGVSSDTYSLTLISLTPPASALVSTGMLIVYDEEGVVEQDVPISIQLVEGPGTAGYSLDTKARTETSDATGLVEFAGMIRGATYRVWRGAASGTEEASVFATRSAGENSTIVVPNSDSFNLPEILGTDVEA